MTICEWEEEFERCRSIEEESYTREWFPGIRDGKGPRFIEDSFVTNPACHQCSVECDSK